MGLDIEKTSQIKSEFKKFLIKDEFLEYYWNKKGTIQNGINWILETLDYRIFKNKSYSKDDIKFNAFIIKYKEVINQSFSDIGY